MNRRWTQMDVKEEKAGGLSQMDVNGRGGDGEVLWEKSEGMGLIVMHGVVSTRRPSLASIADPAAWKAELRTLGMGEKLWRPGNRQTSVRQTV